MKTKNITYYYIQKKSNPLAFYFFAKSGNYKGLLCYTEQGAKEMHKTAMAMEATIFGTKARQKIPFESFRKLSLAKLKYWVKQDAWHYGERPDKTIYPVLKTGGEYPMAPVMGVGEVKKFYKQ